MAYELVEEVLDHAPADLSGTEVLLLVGIAEQARKPSRMADIPTADLARRVRVEPESLKKVIQRLSKRGIDVRLVIGIDKIGRPIYAVPGRVSTYVLPLFPAPENCPCHRCVKGVPSSLLQTKEGRQSRQAGRQSRQGGYLSRQGGTTVPPIPSGETGGLSPGLTQLAADEAVANLNGSTTHPQASMHDLDQPAIGRAFVEPTQQLPIIIDARAHIRETVAEAQRKHRPPKAGNQ